MTQPITVYPTETPGLYRTQAGFDATQLIVSRGDMIWCVICLQLCESPSHEHWWICGGAHCSRCVMVADEDEGP